MNTRNDHQQLNIVDQACLRIGQHDYSGAERLARQELSGNPKSCPALNAMAVVFCHTGRQDQAMQVLKDTIETQPGDPNAYYNLASILYGEGKIEESLAMLERLFAKAQCSTPGSATVFSCAFSLCQHVQGTLADKNHEAAAQSVEGFRKSIETLTGYPVVIHFEDLDPSMGAYTETALQRGCHQHDVHCNRGLAGPLQPHLLAHELMHIELEAEAHRVGKAKSFLATGVNPRFKSQFFLPRPQVRRLRKQGWDESAIARVLANQVDNLLLHLFNCPLDLVVETRVRDRFPDLSAAQFLAIGRLLERAPKPGDVLTGDSVMPRHLVRAALALNDVRARLYDSMFAHTTAHALTDTDTEVFPLASRLWECWRSAAPSLKSGDEYGLVDQFAEILGLRQGYRWVSKP